MSQYLWIALGSGVDGMARFALSGFIAHRFGDSCRHGGFIVNVIRSPHKNDGMEARA